VLHSGSDASILAIKVASHFVRVADSPPMLFGKTLAEPLLEIQVKSDVGCCTAAGFTSKKNPPASTCATLTPVPISVASRRRRAERPIGSTLDCAAAQLPPAKRKQPRAAVK
jgi:hypothetical protein